MLKVIFTKKGVALGLLFIALLSFVVWHEVVSQRVSTKGYYQGVVIDKIIDVGRKSSTYYLYIDWDGMGKYSIPVHPVTYKRTKVGERFSTQYSYVFLLGAMGGAYVPHSDEYGVFFGVAGMMARFCLLFLLCYFGYAGYRFLKR